MSTHITSKINQLLQIQPSGTVYIPAFLEKQGFSRDLQKKYRKSGWLESIGTGAMIRSGDKVDWLGGIYALQQQVGLQIHVGGRTSLGMQGQAHYLELHVQTVQLFAPHKVVLPTWFKNYHWNLTPELHHTNFLPSALGMIDIDHKLFAIKASGAARALMESLYMAPDKFDLVEAYQIMEGMSGLRPVIVQQLLEQCNSIKVKRLFLYMAEKSGHAWFKYLNFKKFNLGNGKRSFASGGIYNAKYKITMPEELCL